VQLNDHNVWVYLVYFSVYEPTIKSTQCVDSGIKWCVCILCVREQYCMYVCMHVCTLLPKDEAGIWQAFLYFSTAVEKRSEKNLTFSSKIIILVDITSLCLLVGIFSY
jgi:hypothetical protein